MNADSILPLFDGNTEWLNGTANPRETKGHPTLVHFWSVSSEIAIVNLSQLAEWRDQRKREGLRFIAVHSPAIEQEMYKKGLSDAVSRLNLTEPCVLDNDHRLSRAFANENNVVPAYFLFDPDGRLRSFSTGADLERVEDSLDQMLEELRARSPFCPACELFLETDALYCPSCGLPLILPGSPHPYYEKHHS